MSTHPEQAQVEALLPCPFCGGSACEGIVGDDPTNHGGHFVSCVSCGASTNLRFACGDDPTPLLIEQWNRRAALTPQAPADQFADVRKMVPAPVQPVAPSIEAAYEMGATGSPAVDAERLAFEAWMRGHCWALSATWTGTQYLSDAERGGHFDPLAMATRRLWAAWRDRAALAQGAQR